MEAIFFAPSYLSARVMEMIDNGGSLIFRLLALIRASVKFFGATAVGLSLIHI